MADHMGRSDARLPAEVDWTRAPALLEGARTLDLTPEKCNLDYWLDSVAGGSLRGLVRGHHPDTEVPEHMLQHGPLRAAAIQEFSFQALAEDKATRGLSSIIPLTPNTAHMEFYATQLLDEARHARIFRGHLAELGVADDELPLALEKAAGQDARDILFPLEAFGLGIVNKGDYYGAVVTLTILVEGVLAPTTELSERKWQPLNPAAAQIQRSAGLDEIRHLCVGSTIVRRYLHERPEQKPRILDVITRGRDLWDSLPLPAMLQRQEDLFQEGMREHAHLLDSYEIWDGRRLVDTSAQERVETALNWSRQTQDARLTAMGLPEAV
jgi:hypothetical protein